MINIKSRERLHIKKLVGKTYKCCYKKFCDRRSNKKERIRQLKEIERINIHQKDMYQSINENGKHAISLKISEGHYTPVYNANSLDMLPRWKMIEIIISNQVSH